MKNDLIWTKTILSVYRYLERICGAIDKIVVQTGLNSSNITGYNYSFNNVFAITERIIDLSERKVTLINLKLIIEEVLSKIDEEDAQILIEKYVDSRKCKEIAEIHDVSMRTLFRKIDSAENSFGKHLRVLGYDDKKLDKFLKNEQWIVNVYNDYSANKAEEISLSNSFLERAASI